MAVPLDAIYAQLLAAPRGGKRALVELHAEQHGCSAASLYRRLQAIASRVKPRKRRADAGQLALSRAQACDISAAIEETRKLTGSGTMPMEEAIRMLRANGRIDAGRMDAATGEWTPLSVSAIARALRHYTVHPEQVAAPTPAARLCSPHPNYLWQIDASISRQFYLHPSGARPMPQAAFYRGKPRNFEAIADLRLWRYVITDHASGCIALFYVQGAESSANLLAALMHAMTRRPGGTLHGVPKFLMMDPGSAGTAAATRNFVDAMGIGLIVNQVGNARAKGQVENAHYLVETSFEAALKMCAPVRCLEEINTLGQTWAEHYNRTRIHSRTGMSRHDGFGRITPEQLILAPSLAVMQALPNGAPKACTVRDCMVRFKGHLFDVRGLPGLINGQKVQVVRNALDAGSVRVLLPGTQDSAPQHFIARQITHDAWGFVDTAAQVGVGFNTPPQTPADAARKEIERLAMAVATDAEAKSARKAKRLAFGGTIDPTKHWREAAAALPPALPRAGTPSTVTAPSVVAGYIEPPQVRAEIPLLNHVEAAMSLKPLVERAGSAWMPDMYMRTATRWPEGVPHDAIESWATELATPRGLYLVEGGAA